MARMLLCGYLPDGFGKSICLRFMFDKKLGRDNSLVVIVHRYLQQLPPPSVAHVCTSDKRVEADRRLTALLLVVSSLLCGLHTYIPVYTSLPCTTQSQQFLILWPTAQPKTAVMIKL